MTMRKSLGILAVSFALLSVAACHPKAAPAVPGSVDAIDAKAYRVTADAQSVIHSAKTWELCSANGFPTSTLVDGNIENCDATQGVFPPSYKADLNRAIDAYNIAENAGKAYHSGLSTDGAALTNDLTQLSAAVATLLQHLGGK